MTYDPTGVLIDGAVPRSPQERCKDLLAHAKSLSEQYEVDNERAIKQFDAEIHDHWEEEDYEWNDLEDEVVELIDETLPSSYCVDYPDAGDVVIMGSEDDG